jgi:hypothetical protein
VTPHWIYEFPRLAWYADGANPISRELPDISPRIIETSDIEILGLIHESQISIVSRGQIIPTGQEVVIKKYKTPTTSDGLARDDIHISLSL